VIDPETGDPARGVSAAPRPPDERGDLRSLAILIALGLGLRLIIAYVLPGSGFRGDLASFEAWASNLATDGPWGFYERPFLHDYPPGYMYVLWALGELRQLIAGPGLLGDFVKAPAIVADLVLTWLVHSMTLEIGASRRRALVAAAIVLFVPITWFDSVVWGQVDSVGLIFLLLGLRSLWRDEPEKAALWATIAAVVKPQLGILVPIVAGVTIARYLLPRDPEDDRPDPRDPPPAAPFRAVRRWLVRERGPIRIATTGLVGLVTAVVLAAPFKLSIIDLVRQVGVAAGGYPYLTVNAYNLWALVEHDGASLASNYGFQCDAIASAGSCADPTAAVLIGPFWAVAVGTALLLALVGAVTVLAARHPSRITLLVALTVLAVAFFVVPTRVHERYLLPFVPLAAILAVVSARWAVAYAVATVTMFLNMYVVLTTVYPGNPQISDWLGIGPDIRSATSVTIIAIAVTAVFLFSLTELRPAARRRLAAEVAATRLRGDPAVVAGEAPGPRLTANPPRPLPPVMPRVTSVVPGWLLRRAYGRPIRPDRSRGLDEESTGRIDRLDLLLIGLVVIGAMVLRTARVEQPYQMMFDEVYHVRTATEFLQDWRYGEPHQIYEWTHPHLAKYAIAAGIVLFAGDHVTATSGLGTPVRDAAIEPRYDDPTASSGRGGDRLHVATGDGVRVYDLASRAPIADVPWPGARALTIDDVNHRLYIASDDGAIGVLETTTWLDPLGRGSGGEIAPIAPEALIDVGAPVVALHVTGDGGALFVATGSDEVVVVDPWAATETGRTPVEGVTAFADAGDAESLVATPTAVVDPVGVAALLSSYLDDSETVYLKLLRSASEQVTIGPVDAAARPNIEAAIADGRLAGLVFASERRVAAAGRTGVTFLASGSGQRLAEVPTDGPATGLALVTGVDAGADLYVASGAGLTRVSVDASQDPAGAGSVWLPGPARDVRFDAATKLVHVLGSTPDGAGTTVYTVEPHGNAVFSDIPLPFAPAAWGLDAAQRYPASDREDLLALAADGSVASADIGGYSFAGRLPGVIAGALTAGLLYALARILFRRRVVAIATAAFVLAEGMLFAQARIAMNDVYVGCFIVAGYTLLAWLLAEPFRRQRAFWVALPLVGLLLGLGLASKWVAAYAIAGAIVLILARSALGRVLVIGGLIVATVGLGTLAVSVVPAPTAGPNWAFFVIMVALTLLAVVVTVARPIAWSVDEVRFATGAPIVGGVAVWGVGLLIGQGEAAARVGLALVALGGIAYAAFLVGRVFGVGPLAPPPGPDHPAAYLPKPSPAPAPWLRLGSSLGLPAVWGAISLLVVPIVVYVVSYLPWVSLGNRLTESWPPGEQGQTLADLTVAMYDYHDKLRAAHAAYSPWWAWPFDLKPVWFYSATYAQDTAAAVYDTGSLVVFWLGVAAMVFVAWQAWARRSPSLALLAIAFAWQWLPWARIDRGTFQYHYYTALPFVVVALGYLVAELWHGPSRRTWLGIRIAAAVAIVAPALMWLFRGPLCTVAGVERARPGSEVCAASPGALPNVGAVLGEGAAAFLRAMPPEALALVFLVPLAAVAWFVVTARDARRFAGGMIVAAASWILVWYPNISALPLPSRVYNAYQGVLPTWVWAFQFPVNLEPATEAPDLATLGTLVLLGAMTATCLIVGYAAWSWRLAAAERDAAIGVAEGPIEGGSATGSG
jgi:4-amino-4-deoxy-L-arabinose transferase-like glycosyltransferase